MPGQPREMSEAAPYVSTDRAAGDNKDYIPLPKESDLAYLNENGGRKEKHRQAADIHSSTCKSSSDPRLRKRTSIQEATGAFVQTAFSSSMSTTPSVSLQPARPKRHRSFSSSQVETGSRSKALVSPDTTGHRAIVTKPSNIVSRFSTRPIQHRCESGTHCLGVQTEGEETTADLSWSSATRPNSDPDLRKTFRISNKPDLNKPLKTCLKQRAKSADTTPPNGSLTGTTSSFENQKLWHMKTVDFESAILTPPSRLRTSSKDIKYQRGRPRKASERAPSCPGMTELIRHSPAHPAVTRTDVHVIAITPRLPRYTTSSLPQPKEVEDIDLATPTMQIMESSNGSYEVIWDDVPPEHSARTRRRSSSASQALERISSTAARGLDRVNTKLTEWSGTWNGSSDSFKPTIVVFPDDDSRKPHSECAILDEEEIGIFAPPNSERVSAIQSRHPSRPVSAPMSRATSQDEFNKGTLPQDALVDIPATTLGERTLIVPDSDAWSAHLVTARRNLAVPSPERKLSNVDEADTKFRNHRDSVTIAHSRLLHSGGVRPELFARSDSISIARKRMHANNQAISPPRHTYRPKSKSEPGILQDDDASAIPPLPVVKAHAAEALKKGNLAPILRPSDLAGSQHVQIQN